VFASDPFAQLASLVAGLADPGDHGVGDGGEVRGTFQLVGVPVGGLDVELGSVEVVLGGDARMPLRFQVRNRDRGLHTQSIDSEYNESYPRNGAW